MHIGLFFGSFNPIHIGHLAIANYMQQFTDMEEVWLVVSPHNPLKEKAGLLEQNHRLFLVDLAIDNSPGLRSSNIEFKLPQPSYTVNTLAHLSEKYAKYRFSLIMGQDNLATFNKWKNHEAILKSHRIYVYPRPGAAPSLFDTHPQVHFTDAPLMEISSTFLRKAIKGNKDLRFFFPPNVWQQIDAMGFYK